jgi:hypothetical protein
MGALLVIGPMLLALGLLALVAGALGATELVPSLVLGGVLVPLGGVITFVAYRIKSGFERDLSRVRELAERGTRRVGQVKDVVAYASEHGGAVLHPEGALLVVQVELESAEGVRETVQCLLVENSEVARARIGRDVTVVEHPEDPSLRALEGYLPNGDRRAS